MCSSVGEDQGRDGGISFWKDIDGFVGGKRGNRVLREGEDTWGTPGKWGLAVWRSAGSEECAEEVCRGVGVRQGVLVDYPLVDPSLMLTRRCKRTRPAYFALLGWVPFNSTVLQTWPHGNLSLVRVTCVLSNHFLASDNCGPWLFWGSPIIAGGLDPFAQQHWQLTNNKSLQHTRHILGLVKAHDHILR